MILLCSISCSDLNCTVDGGGGDDSFEFNNMLYLSYKIRFEALKGQRGRKIDKRSKDDACKVLFYKST
jgi:hypothetical protein